ncbi:DUF659 domain-containing protein, partial [Favolaschia claudopus]
SVDGWKSKKKDSVNGLCANVDYKAFLLELVDVTALSKDGPSLARLFGEIIDRVEVRYNCIVIYFGTDADGGSKKGRIILGKERPWLIVPSCWAHQFQLILGDYFKVYEIAAVIAEEAVELIAWINNHARVRKIFDDAQAEISQDRLSRVVILAYLVANLTRWTTHFIAFARLFLLREALQLAVLRKRASIVAAQVGAATHKEADRLREEASKFCHRVQDQTFWVGLETVLEDLESICLGTNINQKDSTRLDQVVLSIGGIYLRFDAHPEAEVRAAMCDRIEKRWKDSDQPVFLLALILNPFEKLTCFGPNANLNFLKIRNMLLTTYRRIMSRPSNTDTTEIRADKEKQILKALKQYLAGTGDFADFDAVQWKADYDSEDPVEVWESLELSQEITELARFAILILNIVVNQAGVERAFSRAKIEQSDHRVNLKLDKIDKRIKVKAELRSQHEKQGLNKRRLGRKNHKSVDHLLTVPRYRDALEGEENSDTPPDARRLIVGTVSAWQKEEMDSLDASDEDPDTALPRRLPKFVPITLKTLFGEATKPRQRRIPDKVREEEERLMEELADAAEDEIPDDGAIEIGSDEEFVG